MKEPITSKTYDAHVCEQGLEYQVKMYYEPQGGPERKRIELIFEQLPLCGSQMLLDIGCGVGTFAFHAALRGAISIGVDYSFESIRTARSLCARYALKGQTHFAVANGIHLPFGEGAFHCVVACDFIEHITDREKKSLLAEMKRVLKEDGKIVIFTPNKIREDMGYCLQVVKKLFLKRKITENPAHYGLITRSRFERMLKKEGFKFRFCYRDSVRPYLAKIIFFRRFLALNLLWVLER